MKASEILRKLADLIDGKESAANVGSSAELTPVEVDNTDHSEDAVYIAPLQQKLELLKKAAGVESVYDDQGSDDEMDIMKRNAGIAPVVLQVASDDEPLDM